MPLQTKLKFQMTSSSNCCNSHNLLSMGSGGGEREALVSLDFKMTFFYKIFSKKGCFFVSSGKNVQYN